MAYNPKTGKGLGRFYSAEHRAFRAREWRGFRDTFYDFFRWLYLYGFMAAKLGCHPILMVKAMLRYRWMVSYLTASHMVDRHTMGLRGKELRYAHNQFFSVLHNSVLGVRDIIVRDQNLRPNSKRAAKLRENTVMFDEMTPHLIMMGFPTVKWIDIAMFAVGLPSEVDQNASMFYIDAMEHLGLPADVCPEPAAECGVAVVDDYPRVGKCYFTGTMPCDGAISQTNILTRHFKDLPSFQITPPQRVNEPEVQTYAVKNLSRRASNFSSSSSASSGTGTPSGKAPRCTTTPRAAWSKSGTSTAPTTRRSAARRWRCSANMSSRRRRAWTSSCTRRTCASRR